MKTYNIGEKIMENENETPLQDKKPSIKLAQARRNFPGESGTMYVVVALVDSLIFEIGQRLTKPQVLELLDNGTVKVSISGEK